MTRAVVMFSGGVGSYHAAKRALARFSADNTTLLFTDVRGEDEDCYRFIREGAEFLGVELVWLTEGRTIWEVFKDDKFLGNSRLANCSKFLKQKPAREWLDAHRSSEDTTVVIGIDWTETHRVPAIENAYAPFPTWCPLTEPPYVDKQAMLDACRADGIEPPVMYAQGYPHANCGGGCVRAGIGQFTRLYQINPARYREWEDNEQELREHLGRDVAILRDRRGGTSTPMTLRDLRERFESEQQLTLDMDDIGGCGCFVE